MVWWHHAMEEILQRNFRLDSAVQVSDCKCHIWQVCHTRILPISLFVWTNVPVCLPDTFFRGGMIAKHRDKGIAHILLSPQGWKNCVDLCVNHHVAWCSSPQTDFTSHVQVTCGESSPHLSCSSPLRRAGFIWAYSEQSDASNEDNFLTLSTSVWNGFWPKALSHVCSQVEHRGEGMGDEAWRGGGTSTANTPFLKIAWRGNHQK